MSKHHTGRRRIHMLALTAMAAVAVAAGCTPMPGTNLVEGGDYVVEVTVPSQHITNEFVLPFGLGTCTAAVTTPEVSVPGSTVTLPAFEYDPGAATATLPEVSVRLPRSKVSAGSFSLTCGGQLIGRIGVSIEFDAVASMRSATLDLDTREVTLDQPTLTITDAEATFAGAPSGTPPVQLDPFTLEIPEFRVRV